MEPDMGYLILFALLAVPLLTVGAFLLAMAAGLIHEPTPAESAARNYATSWKQLTR